VGQPLGAAIAGDPFVPWLVTLGWPGGCRLQKWARLTFGSCAGLWDQACDAKGASALCTGKMLLHALDEFLRTAGWPAGAGRILLALDLHGCGFVQRSDLEWLDKWEVPPWFDAEPDPAAWSELRRLLLREHGHPLRAWRLFMSRDDSGTICWQEFRRACKTVNPHANAVGAWRYLDQDQSGAISLREFDADVADTLQSFKDWSDLNFGSVTSALRAVDADGNGFVTYYELHRECRRLRWQGSTRELFRCLVAIAPKVAKDVGPSDGDWVGPQGRKAVTLKSLRFLDKWHAISHVQQAGRHRPLSDVDDLPPASPAAAAHPSAPAEAPPLKAAAGLRRATSEPAAASPAPPAPLRRHAPSPGSQGALPTASERQMRATLLLPKGVASTRKRRLRLCSLPPVRGVSAVAGPTVVLVGM
ncbi:unnamed protein product, partial [Prorocentrum cordatum]